MSRTLLRLLTLMLLISGLFLVTACGTGGTDPGGDAGDDGDAPTDGASRIGYAGVSETHPDGEEPTASAGAAFMSYDAELPDDYVASPFEADTCTVLTLDDVIDFPVPDEDVEVAPLSAGDQLTLEAGGDVHARLEPVGTGGEGSMSFYSASGTLTAPLPDGLVLDVPGDEFPAFEDVAVPDVEPLVLNAPADATIDAGTTFEWEEGTGDANTWVTFSAYSTDGTSVDCIAADDGTFAFPAETVAELGADFSGSLETAGRTALSSETRGDAVLFVFADWTRDFGFELPTGF